MIAIILMLILSLCGCSLNVSEPNNGFKIMSWNVQNLMDDKLDGDEYSEYTPSKGWDDIAYLRRLKIASIIIKKENADVVFLQEIEHSGVLKDLLEKYLVRKGYKYYGSIKKEGSAISIGFISKIKPIDIKVHGVENNRPILQVDFTIKGERVTFFCVHAKSKYGGEAASEKDRINLSKTLKLQLKKDEDHMVIMVGDFNEDPSKTTDEMTALILSDNKNYYNYTQKGSLGISNTKDCIFSLMMYSPLFDDEVKKSMRGTYFYNGEWSSIDQIMGNAFLVDGADLEFNSFNIVNNDMLLTSSGIPYRWEIKGLCGISDHLPVVMTLK
jgi:endonuclease/exonuclease/phosphatase family metal-dependent hydrolase